MTSTAANIIQFVFILLVPLVVVAGALVTLFAVGALFNALEHPEELGQRIEGLFRQPPRPPRETAPDHYYRPYWKAHSYPPVQGRPARSLVASRMAVTFSTGTSEALLPHSLRMKKPS